MPQIEIYVSEADIEAAKRIGEKMFPEALEAPEAKFVIAAAADIGMERLKVIWEPPAEGGKP